jgi:hypothetical protein
MRRRQRRLFNLFAFVLLGIAVYLNMFRMNDDEAISLNKKLIVKTQQKAPPQIIPASKTILRQELHKNN